MANYSAVKTLRGIQCRYSCFYAVEVNSRRPELNVTAINHQRDKNLGYNVLSLKFEYIIDTCYGNFIEPSGAVPESCTSCT